METSLNNRAWSQRRCSCGKCGQVLRAYLQDPNSIYPMGAEMQPTYKIGNPLKSRSKQPTRYEREKQIYFRVARALGVANAAKKKEIHVSVVHYTRWSIQNYNNDTSEHKPRFQYYLIPNDINNRYYLQRDYAVEDEFNCIGTTKETLPCRNNAKLGRSCVCNQFFINAPRNTIMSLQHNLQQQQMDVLLQQQQQQQQHQHQRQRQQQQEEEEEEHLQQQRTQQHQQHQHQQQQQQPSRFTIWLERIKGWGGKKKQTRQEQQQPEQVDESNGRDEHVHDQIPAEEEQADEQLLPTTQLLPRKKKRRLERWMDQQAQPQQEQQELQQQQQQQQQQQERRVRQSARLNGSNGGEGVSPTDKQPNSKQLLSHPSQQQQHQQQQQNRQQFLKKLDSVVKLPSEQEQGQPLPDEEVPVSNRTRSANRMRQQQQQEVQQEQQPQQDLQQQQQQQQQRRVRRSPRLNGGNGGNEEDIPFECSGEVKSSVDHTFANNHPVAVDAGFRFLDQLLLSESRAPWQEGRGVSLAAEKTYDNPVKGNREREHYLRNSFGKVDDSSGVGDEELSRLFCYGAGYGATTFGTIPEQTVIREWTDDIQIIATEIEKELTDRFSADGGVVVCECLNEMEVVAFFDNKKITYHRDQSFTSDGKFMKNNCQKQHTFTCIFVLGDERELLFKAFKRDDVEVDRWVYPEAEKSFHLQHGSLFLLDPRDEQDALRKVFQIYEKTYFKHRNDGVKGDKMKMSIGLVFRTCVSVVTVNKRTGQLIPPEKNRASNKKQEECGEYLEQYLESDEKRQMDERMKQKYLSMKRRHHGQIVRDVKW